MSHSGKWWYLELISYLNSEEAGFRQSTKCDQASFVRTEEDGSITPFLVYTDDGLYKNSTNGPKWIKKFEKEISARFHVELKGSTHWFLAMIIQRDRFGNFILDQARYTLNIGLKYLGTSEQRKVTNRPLPHDFEATREDCSKSESQVKTLADEFRFEYISAIDSLVYLLNTRPDIMFTVTKLAKFMQYLGRKHFLAVVHLIIYTKDSHRLGLRFYHKFGDSPLHETLKQIDQNAVHPLVGFQNSSWQDCPDTGRSTGSYINYVQGGAADFLSFLLAPVAVSSAESENNAGAVPSMAMSHLRMLWNEINDLDPDITWTPPIQMYCDNTGAVALANSEKDSKAQRHVKRRLFCMRQMRRESKMSYNFIESKYMSVNCSTKNHDVSTLNMCRNLFLVNVPE